MSWSLSKVPLRSRKSVVGSVRLWAGPDRELRKISVSNVRFNFLYELSVSFCYLIAPVHPDKEGVVAERT